MNPPNLSIAIPTFNRADILIETLQSLRRDQVDRISPIVVVDNGSTDDTHLRLAGLIEGTSLTTLSYADRISFAESIFRIFDSCTTDYVMVLSDEDGVRRDGLEGLIQFLAKRNPVFVSPTHTMDGRSYRGRATTRKMKPQEFISASFYLSGLVFHRRTALKSLDTLRSQAIHEMAIEIYPQTVLSAAAATQGDCWWFQPAVTYKRAQAETHIGLHIGESGYWSLQARVEQYSSFKRTLSDMERRLASPRVAKHTFAGLQRGVMETLYTNIRHAAELQSPGISRAIDRSALSYLLGSTVRRLRQLPRRLKQ